MRRSLFGLLASLVVVSTLGESPEPAKVRITTWNLEWFPNGSARDATPEVSQDPRSQATQHLHVHLKPVDLISQWNEMISKFPSRDLEAKDATTKALPVGQDIEATRPTATTQLAEGCAREEKTAQKELTGVDRAPKA